jgi:hypothetical protein
MRSVIAVNPARIEAHFVEEKAKTSYRNTRDILPGGYRYDLACKRPRASLGPGLTDRR